MPVYNALNGTTSFKEMSEICMTFNHTRPMRDTVWAPPKDVRNNILILDHFYAVVLHFLPALLIDFCLKNFLHQKPRYSSINIFLRSNFFSFITFHF